MPLIDHTILLQWNLGDLDENDTNATAFIVKDLAS